MVAMYNAKCKKILAEKIHKMEDDVGRRRGRHLQETKKLQIHQINRSGCKTKEITAALKVSIRAIQRVKVPPSVKTAVRVKKKLDGPG